MLLRSGRVIGPWPAKWPSCVEARRHLTTKGKFLSLIQSRITEDNGNAYERRLTLLIAVEGILRFRVHTFTRAILRGTKHEEHAWYFYQIKNVSQ